MKRYLSFLMISLSVCAAAVGAQTRAAAYMTEPSLSPDRREIAFVSGGDIWSVPVEGGPARLLVSHPATESRPLFSPDGRRLAFGSARTGAVDIYILDLETGELRRLTYDDTPENLDAWSRDGKWIYFSSAGRDIAGMNDIFRIPASGGTAMQVSADRYTSEYQAAPMPDGSIIFAARGISAGQWWRRGRSHIDESELWQKTGDKYTQLTERGAKQMWPMTVPDGSRVFFVSDRSGAQNIWVRDRAGQARALTNFADGRVLWPSISFDGREIVFERDFRIWHMRTDGGRPEAVPITLRGVAAGPLTERVSLGTQIRDLALSPDGKKVAVIARGEIFAASAKDGGEAVRITTTAAPESYVSWTADSRKLVYVSERNGTAQIFQYDFGAESESQVTSRSDAQDASPIYSPDGKLIAFIRDARSLMLYDTASKQEREIAKLYTDPPPLLGERSFAWSPDSKWVAFLTYVPEQRSYTNASIVPVDGGPARPVSFLANSNAGTVTWSPDGSFLLFDSSQRTEDTVVARVDLKLQTPRFREDQFRDLFRQENPQDRRPPAPRPSPTAAPLPTPSPSVIPSPTASPEKKDEPAQTEIVFEDIRRRMSYINTGVDGGSPMISPDGKTLLVLASSEGQFNLYTIALDELATDTSAKQITSTSGFKSDPHFSPDGKEVFYIENGRIFSVSLDRREVRPLNLSIDMNVNFADEKMEIFRQGWRTMRDHFYDEKYHGVDWEAVRSTYEPMAASAKNIDELRRLMSLMVGELNASHLGVLGQPSPPPAPIGKLGLRFDRGAYETNGQLKITEIIALSPAAVVGGVNVGDHLVSVDGTRIDGRNLDELLENKVGKRVVLRVSASPDGLNARDVVVKPISTGAEKNLLYRQWVEGNRAYVARVSSGRLGYVHIPDMSSNSLTQLYVDLDAENQAKEGVVVDIRNNNGGFINVYVIDVLARRGYLTMRERGLWNVPARTALGQRALERPTILVTNQHSLSDAEDLTEGYRTLKLGKVVGEPTAGWIIYTWNSGLFDGTTTIRLPRQLILGSDGKNMELNPRQVDIPVTRPIGETLSGKDSQLDTAVRELLRQID